MFARDVVDAVRCLRGGTGASTAMEEMAVLPAPLKQATPRSDEDTNQDEKSRPIVWSGISLAISEKKVVSRTGLEPVTR